MFYPEVMNLDFDLDFDDKETKEVENRSVQGGHLEHLLNCLRGPCVIAGVLVLSLSGQNFVSITTVIVWVSFYIYTTLLQAHNDLGPL